MSLSVLDKCPLSPGAVLNAVASLLCIPEVSAGHIYLQSLQVKQVLLLLWYSSDPSP